MPILNTRFAQAGLRSLVGVLAVGHLTVVAGCSRPKVDENATLEPVPEPQMHDASESIPGEKSAEPEGLASKTLGNTADEQGEIIQLSGPQIIARIKSSPSKFTLVNFWASWCGPCRREFPMLMGLRDNMAPQGIEVQFVSLDEPESVPVAIEFAEQHQLELPIFIAQRPISALKEAIHPGWPGMLPATFLFDNAGNLQHFWGGPVYEHELLPILENALAGEDVSGETRFGLSAGKDMRKQ